MARGRLAAMEEVPGRASTSSRIAPRSRSRTATRAAGSDDRKHITRTPAHTPDAGTTSHHVVAQPYSAGSAAACRLTRARSSISAKASVASVSTAPISGVIVPLNINPMGEASMAAITVDTAPMTHAALPAI